MIPCCCCKPSARDGPVATLLRLYCAMRCQGRLVAAALSFHPPRPPLYSVTQAESGWGGGGAGRGDGASAGLRQHAAAGAARAAAPLNALAGAAAAGGGDGDGGWRLVLDPCLPPSDVSPEVRRVRTRRGHEVIVCVYRHPDPRRVILYSHGNATDVGVMHDRACDLCFGCNSTVVTYDYSGYGWSTGMPSELAAYDDIAAVYKHLVDTQVVRDPKRELVVYGESIGSGPSIWLASRRRVCGLVLQAAIASGLRVITESRLLCCCDIFPNLSRIGRVRGPTFVMPGANDQQVAIDHGTRLHAATKAKYRYAPWWVEGAGHNDIVHRYRREYLRRINAFLQFLDGGGGSGGCGAGGESAASSATGVGSAGVGILGAAKHHGDRTSGVVYPASFTT